MLGDKDRMIVPGSLFTVVGRESRGQSFFDELCGMLEDFAHPFLAKILKLLLLQMDPAAKCGLFQSG